MPNLQVKAESGCKKLNAQCLYDTSTDHPNETLIVSYPAFYFFAFAPAPLSELLWQIPFPLSQAIKGLFVKPIPSCSIYLTGSLGWGKLILKRRATSHKGLLGGKRSLRPFYPFFFFSFFPQQISVALFCA